MVHALHLFQGHPVDFAVSLVAHQELSGKRPEAVVRNLQDVGGGDAQDAVRKPDRRGLEVRRGFGHVKHRLARIGNVGCLGLQRRTGFARPAQAAGVARKIARFKVRDAPRTHPVALVFGVEYIAGGGNHANARRRTQSRCPRRDFALGRYAQHPAAPLGQAGPVAHPAQVERNHHVAAGQELGAERILVVIARQRPTAHAFIDVGLAVGVGVAQAREFAALGAVHGSVAVGQAQYLMQSAGKFGVVGRAFAVHVGVFNAPHIAKTRGNQQAAIGHHGQAAHFQFDEFGHRHRNNAVIIILR